MGTENVDLEDNNILTDKPNAKEFHDGDVFEKVLDHVGALGRYQKILLMCLVPFSMTCAFVFYVQIFVTATPQNYWCRIPELANLSLELRQNLSAPGVDAGVWDRCRTFDTNWTEVLNTLTVPSPETPTIPCQHGWEFDFSDIPYETITTEREWVCDNASYAPLANSVFFLGAIIGNIISGWIADRFGRIPALIGTNLVSAISSISATFTKGTWDFILCRFLVGLGFDNCYMVIYILVLEFIGHRYRTIVANVFMATSFGVGSIMLPWIAFYVADWRLLLWTTSLPMFFVIIVKWIVPESIRWLMSRDRVTEALLILKKFESINGAKIPEDVIQEFVLSSNKGKFEKKLSIIELFKSPPLRITMLKFIIICMGGAMIFDGLLRLSDSFGLSLFLVFTGNEIFEFLGALTVAGVVDRLGRRKLTCFPTLLSGICLITSLFVPRGLTMATLALIARFFMILCTTTTMLWYTELLPTRLRASGASFIHITVFVAIFCAPYITYSARVWKLLPMLIFAIVAFSTSWIALTIPETKGRPLPQTLADVEKLIRNNTLWGKKKKVNAEYTVV